MKTTLLSQYFGKLAALDSAAIEFIGINLHLWQECGLLEAAVLEGMRAHVNPEDKNFSFTKDKHAYLGETALGREAEYFKKWGAFAVVRVQPDPILEVRINLPVSHMFANQIFCYLSKWFVEQIKERFAAKRQICTHAQPDRQLEVFLLNEDVKGRHFISSLARAAENEYWEECFTAFSVSEARRALQDLDPHMHSLLVDFVCQPANHFTSPFAQRLKRVRARRGIEPASLRYLLDQPDQ